MRTGDLSREYAMCQLMRASRTSNYITLYLIEWLQIMISLSENKLIKAQYSALCSKLYLFEKELLSL